MSGDEVSWIRNEATGSQIAAILKQRDDLIIEVARLREEVRLMKEEKEPQEEPVEPANESTTAAKPNSNKFTVTDQGEHGYDNDGPFGIGMIKGK
jgi:plastocyanin